jgi:hypothetical protein
MSNRFLNPASLPQFSDGSIQLFGATVGAKNLLPNYPVRTNFNSDLVSSLYSIADTAGLQAALNAKISNPLTANLDFQTYSFENAESASFIKQASNTPAEPGELKLYANDDGKFHSIDENGVDIIIGGGGGGGITMTPALPTIGKVMQRDGANSISESELRVGFTVSTTILATVKQPHFYWDSDTKNLKLPLAMPVGLGNKALVVDSAGTSSYTSFSLPNSSASSEKKMLISDTVLNRTTWSDLSLPSASAAADGRHLVGNINDTTQFSLWNLPTPIAPDTGRFLICDYPTTTNWSEYTLPSTPSISGAGKFIKSITPTTSDWSIYGLPIDPPDGPGRVIVSTSTSASDWATITIPTDPPPSNAGMWLTDALGNTFIYDNINIFTGIVPAADKNEPNVVAANIFAGNGTGRVRTGYDSSSCIECDNVLTNLKAVGAMYFNVGSMTNLTISGSGISIYPLSGISQKLNFIVPGGLGGNVSIRAPATSSGAYDLILPTAQSVGAKILGNDGSGNLSWVTAGDVSYTGIEPTANTLAYCYFGPNQISSALNIFVDDDGLRMNRLMTSNIAAGNISFQMVDQTSGLDIITIRSSANSSQSKLTIQDPSNSFKIETFGTTFSRIGYGLAGSLRLDLSGTYFTDPSTNAVLMYVRDFVHVRGMAFEDDASTNAGPTWIGQGSNGICSIVQPSIGADYDYQMHMPDLNPLNGQFMRARNIRNVSGHINYDMAWETVTVGDVTGPASSVNNEIPLYNGTTGKIIKGSNLTVSSSFISAIGTSTGLQNSAGAGIDVQPNSVFTLINGNIMTEATLTFLAIRSFGGSRKPLRFYNDSDDRYTAIQSHATVGTNYTITLPQAQSTAGQSLVNDGSGNLSWNNLVSFIGPAPTAGKLAAYNDITGNVIYNSGLEYTGTTVKATGNNITLANTANTSSLVMNSTACNINRPLAIQNVVSGNIHTSQLTATAVTQTYTLPEALPTVNGQLLSSTTGGVQSWVNPTSYISRSTTANMSNNQFFQQAGTMDASFDKSKTLITSTCTVKALHVAITVDVGAGNSRVFTVYKNGVATAMIITFTTGTLYASTTSNQVSFVAGDFVALFQTATGATASLGQITMVLN